MSDKKQGIFHMQFNSITQDTNDPTLLKGTVIVHDFEASGNKQIITEEVCVENMQTLVNKRIVCKYIPCENNLGVDALGGHEMVEGKRRITGESIVITETIAIGFISNVYIGDLTNADGTTKKVLYADVVIWNDDKYSNVVGLLQEWLNKGIDINMSVEFLYWNYNVINGIEYIQTPIIYQAHTLLNSEQRGLVGAIQPAYQCAKLLSLNEKQNWNKAINSIVKKEEEKGMDKNTEKLDDTKIEEGTKSSNATTQTVETVTLEGMSSADKRNLLRSSISTQLNVDKWDIWLDHSDITDKDVIFESYNSGSYKYYVASYSSVNGAIVVDVANAKEVERQTVWVKPSEQATLINSYNEKLTEKDNLIATLTKDKEDLSTKYTTQTETLTSLNSKVEEMKPIVEQYEKEQYEKSFNSAKDEYQGKFDSIGALDEFNKEEVQTLIKKSINSGEEGLKAKFELSELIVSKITSKNNVKTEEKIETETKQSINSIVPGKVNKNLNSGVDPFEEQYGFSRD